MAAHVAGMPAAITDGGVVLVPVMPVVRRAALEAVATRLDDEANPA